jgi:hypothetical protein
MLRPPAPRLSKVALAIGVAYVVVLVALTVVPTPTTSTLGIAGGAFRPEAWLTTATWTGGWPGELLANVILFIPVGWLAARTLPLPFAIAAPLLLTVSIEFAQLFLPGRVSDPRDLVANSVGALLGIGLARLLARRPSESKSDGAVPPHAGLSPRP